MCHCPPPIIIGVFEGGTPFALRHSYYQLAASYKAPGHMWLS